MTLGEALRQLKNVEADKDYTRRSRLLILGLEPQWRSMLFPLEVMLRTLQFGSAVALAGLLLILAVGGFSAWKFISPFKLSSLDPASLHAEAQAVDIQIELTGIVYEEPSSLKNQTTTQDAGKSEAKKQAEREAENLGLKSSTSSKSVPSIEDVLDALSE